MPMTRLGTLTLQRTRLKELLEQELSEEQQLEALCFLADIQVDLLAKPSQRSVL